MRRCLSLMTSIAIVALGPSACRPAGPGGAAAGAADDGVIRAACYPMAYFAERIAGDEFAVECPLPDGADPIFWRPAPEVVNDFQRSSLIVLNGAKFERWAINAPLPGSRVVRTAEAIDEPLITIKGVTHSHGPDGEHTHDGVDGHTWVDPANASRQAGAIYEAMAARWPDRDPVFRRGWFELKADLALLDAAFGGLETDGAVLLASHPAYNYLARRHGWSVESFDLDPAAAIKPDALAELRGVVAAAGDARVIMLWESEPASEAADAIAAIGVTNVVFSPAESAPAEGDYMSVMRANLERLRAALGDG